MDLRVRRDCRRASVSLLLSLVALPVWAGLAHADAARGETVFKSRCASCHVLAAGGPARPGPTLAGVVGRQAAAVEGFRYSQALRNAGITWDRARLDAYVAAPQQAVRGTSMAVGLPNAQDRADVIDFLETQR